MSAGVPVVVRGAGAVATVQGLTALVCATVVLIGGFGSADRRAAFGTAGMFILISAALLAAGWALWTGRRWGRGIAIFAQLLLLPVAWYMATGSQRPELGIPLGVVALLALAALFSAQALRWAAYQPDSASSDSAGPDTR